MRVPTVLLATAMCLIAAGAAAKDAPKQEPPLPPMTATRVYKLCAIEDPQCVPIIKKLYQEVYGWKGTDQISGNCPNGVSVPGDIIITRYLMTVSDNFDRPGYSARDAMEDTLALAFPCRKW